MDREASYERTIETLLVALALQASESADARASAAVVEHLAEQHRTIIRSLLANVGHLVHYGSGAEIDAADNLLATLFEQLLAALRRRGSGPLRPGDLVEVVVDRPQDHLKAGAIMRVYFVGDDGTVDLGFESLANDYVVSTVNLVDVQAVEPPRP